LAVLGVEMIEQPLHASRDQALARLTRPVPLCADESCHDASSLDVLAGRYDLINIKLDKTGGLTEALKVKSAAEAQGFAVMIGCMMATSLALAPAFLLAQDVRIVDLDAGLWLKEDRPDALRYDGSLVHPPEPRLWG
jgi:L-alanine-DL-glutamate epimerase-like enolase superfamily enzyme